jgi:endonuclease-3
VDEVNAHVKRKMKRAGNRANTRGVMAKDSKQVAIAPPGRLATLVTTVARGSGRATSKVVRRAKAQASKTAPRAATAARPRTAAGAKVRRRRKLRGDPGAVLERLSRAIKRPHLELAFGDPWQLLIAVILSAQSTDRRVNQVTPEVFRRWPDPAALARAAPSEVEEVIKSTGFFRNKTKAIIGASALITERFGGQVPRSMPEILEVPGVARKTANVVLGSAYQIASGIVIDTHAARVAQRLELTRETAPEKIEVDLCEAFPRQHWIQMSHRLVLHGRYVCTARAPACAACPVNEVCPARLEPGLVTWQERAEREAVEMEARASGFTRV